MKISLCMIVRDEERTLPRCLESAKGLYDELIIVDTGSADNTKNIAREYTDKIFDLVWREDFAYARNAALSYATGEYLLWLDADDVVEAVDRDTLLALLERERPDMLFCPYAAGDLVYERERFLRREQNFRFVGRVHEAVPPRGKILHYPMTVRHLSSEKARGRRNLDIYLRWAAEEPLSPRDLFYYGRELYYHRLYAEAETVLNKMLSSDGWYVNKIAACEVLSRCYEECGEDEKALSALLHSLTLGEPRAYVLCGIGRLFFKANRLREAAFWYETALTCRDHTKEGDFEEPACRSLVPMLQLVVCCWRCGEREKAFYWHKKTEAIAPAHPSVLYNKQFFKA